MIARALLDELTFGAVSRRERPVASHIPYTRHVDDHIVKTRDGLVLTVLKLDGYSFETSDMSEVNARLLGRNDIVRTLANSRFAIASHIVRREVQPRIASSFDNALCREIDERYDAALSKRRMFVNDIYLTIIRRPLQGQAGTLDVLMTKALGRKDAAGESVAWDDALKTKADAAVARMALPESRLPVRLNQQVGLTHLAELARVHDGAYQLARRAVLHQPALARRFDGLLHFGPDLLDDAGLDLDVELGMRRVLMGKQLSQQALEGAAEVGSHGRARRQRGIQRLELQVCRERVTHRVPRLAVDPIGHLEL